VTEMNPSAISLTEEACRRIGKNPFPMGMVVN